MENTANGEHRIDMSDLSPKNEHGNDSNNLMASSVDKVDSIHDKPASVNSTSQDDESQLPTRRQSTVAHDANTNVVPLDVDPKSHQPSAHPELDDDDEPETNNIPNTPQDHPGVDEGFFSVDIGTRAGGDDEEKREPPPNNGVNGIVPSGRRPSVNNSFPNAPGYDPLAGNPQNIPDVNVYQHKKTLAQGMMDLALLSANANQLRYVLESYNRHPYHFFSLAFISFSIILQIAVGVGLIMNSRYDVKKKDDICKANRINDFTVLGIFLVTIVNVLISSFGVADSPPQMKG